MGVEGESIRYLAGIAWPDGLAQFVELELVLREATHFQPGSSTKGTSNINQKEREN